MKSFILPALAIALFAACSGEEALTSENNVQQTTQNDAVTFDAYLNRTVTRAGQTGAMDLAKLQATDKGFGVFAYYADGDLYSENAIPDFMYNQQVTYDDGTGTWKYSPLKYWPNEFGSSAVSTGVDRVTFFAYAPYVAVDPATGQLTSTYTNAQGSPELSTETGITALTRNGKTGDPYVRYVGAFNPDDCVDLLYGVAADDFKSYVGALDGANNIKKGDPFINVAKPEIGARLKFDFKHALAKLTVNVDADVDIVSHDDGDALDGNTRIWIRSITFDGIAQRGYLNLNNGMWYEVINGNKISHASVTIHDGLRDGAEPLATDEYETPTGLNPDLVQSVSYTTTLDEGSTFPYKTVTTASVPGVTSAIANQPLFGSSSHSLMVIPANEQLKVTIVYDVETADATLPNYLSDGVTKGSTVENRITKNITLDGKALKLDAGKEYTLNLHLGMTSVKFDAQVSDAWTYGGTADNTWLPENAKVIAANSTTTLSVPAEAGEYTYKITGLTASSTKTLNSLPTGWNAVWTPDDPAASGILTITVPVNTSVSKQSQDVTLTEDGDPLRTTKITINQAAVPLGLKIEEAAQKMSGGTDIVLSADATVNWSSDVDASQFGTDDPIVVYKGSEKLTYNASPTADGQFKWDATNNKIVLYTAAKAGEVYTITVKAGDAEAETVSFTVLKKDATISYTVSAVTVGNDTSGTTTIDPVAAASDTGYSVTYESSDTSVATVDTDGKVTGVAAGECDITVTVTDTENYHFAAPTMTVRIEVTTP